MFFAKSSVSQLNISPARQTKEAGDQPAVRAMPATNKRMSDFLVTIRVPGQLPLTYSAIGTDSVTLAMDAQDRFGPCGASVKPARALQC